MKALYLLLLVVFLAFRAESNPNPPDQKNLNIPERAALQADEEDLKDEPAQKFRAIRRSCSNGRGYCLPRQYFCALGLMFKEEYNDCPQKGRNKCCLARTG